MVFLIQSISFSDDRSFENSIADILSLISLYTYYMMIIKQIYQAKPANAAMLQLIVGFLVGAVFVSIFSGSGSNYSVRLFIDWSVFFLKRGEDREKERRRALFEQKKEPELSSFVMKSFLDLSLRSFRVLTLHARYADDIFSPFFPNTLMI